MTKKEVKKELLLFGILFSGALLIGIVLLLFVFSSANGTAEAPTAALFLKMLFHDHIWILWSAYAAVLLSGVLFFLFKNKTFDIIAVLSVILAVAALICVFWFYKKGDTYGCVNEILLKLHIIDAPIGFLDVKITGIITTFCQSFAFCIAFGIVNLVLTFIRLNRLNGILKHTARIGGIFLAFLLAGSPFKILTQPQGIPSADYSTHTLVTHLEDYRQTVFFQSFLSPLADIAFSLAMASFLAFLFWCVEKICTKAVLCRQTKNLADTNDTLQQ